MLPGLEVCCSHIKLMAAWILIKLSEQVSTKEAHKYFGDSFPLNTEILLPPFVSNKFSELRPALTVAVSFTLWGYLMRSQSCSEVALSFT